MSGYAFHPDAFADLDEIWEGNASLPRASTRHAHPPRAPRPPPCRHRRLVPSRNVKRRRRVRHHALDARHRSVAPA